METDIYKVVGHNYYGVEANKYMYIERKSVDLFEQKLEKNNMLNYCPKFYPETFHIAPESSIGWFCFTDRRTAIIFAQNLGMTYHKLKKMRILKIRGMEQQNHEYRMHWLYDLFNLKRWEADKKSFLKDTMHKDEILFRKIEIIEEVFTDRKYIT